MKTISVLAAVLLFLVGFAIAATNEGTSAPPPVILDTGGPDAFGYIWEDNDNGGSPVYDWIDITSIGTQVTGLTDDNTVGPVGMGFEFPYYGYTVNQMWIGSNGYISFSSNYNFAHPFAGIPTAGLPNDLIAVLTGDLDFTQGNGECWYYTNNVDSFVISYLHVREYGDANSSHTFQAIFTSADSRIRFQYGPNQGTFLDSNGEHLTLLGIENVTGQVGLEYLHNNLPAQRIWHEGLVIVFQPGLDPGFLTGIVSDFQLNPINGAIVNIDFFADTVGSDGAFFFEIPPTTYSCTATAEFHNDVTIDNIVITANDTTVQDFALPTPLINVDTSTIQLQLEIGQVVTVQRNVANVGDGELEFHINLGIGADLFSVRRESSWSNSGTIKLRSKEQLMNTRNEYSPTYTIGHLPTILDFGDEVFMFDSETPTGDWRCLGVEFTTNEFWVTGANNQVNLKLHRFDINGNLLNTYDQPNNSSWGWRDLAWDGQYLYASDGPEVDIIDPANGQMIGSFNGPENPNRALAYDPISDHFWTANWGSNIYEFDRNGNTINAFPNPQELAIYGMAWDDASPDGPWLWTFSQDGNPELQFSQFDPFTGTFTGLVFFGIDNGSNGIAGGAGFTTDWDPNLGILFGLNQGTPDIVRGYEITSNAQWLTVNPMYGILQPSENVNLDITIDFTGDYILPGSTYTADISIINNTPVTPVIPVTATAIIILYESVIKGTVSDTTAIPIYGVTVLAEGTEIIVTTDSLGQYSLEDLADGNYDVTFSHPDYWDTTVTDVYVSESDTAELNIELYLQEACPFILGDINASEDFNTLDITYGVSYFKGGNPPICEPCALCPIWYYCGDVNSSCSYNGLDITYGVAYFKGGPAPIPCADCPPVE